MSELYTGMFSALGASTATTTVVNSNIETKLVGVQIPIGFVSDGTSFRILAFGNLKTKAAPEGAVTWRLRLGPFTLMGSILTSIVPNTGGGLSNESWDAEFLVTIRSIGISGKVIANGSVIGNLGSSSSFRYAGSGMSEVTVDTTIFNILELTFQFATAHANNVMNCYNATIHRIKV